jgi:hypothetical protein
MTLRNYRKLPYWALHTYFGKCIRANAVASDMGTINSSDRIAAIGTWFVSGIYGVFQKELYNHNYPR